MVKRPSKKVLNSKTSHEIRQWIKLGERYIPVVIRWVGSTANGLRKKFSKPEKIDLSDIKNLKRKP